MSLIKKRKVTTIIEEIDDVKHTSKVISKTERFEYWPSDHFLSCANYLISFFFRTDRVYSCTRTKIGKLLSILAFKYAINDITLFDEPIYKYENCGTYIKSTNCLERDIYVHIIGKINDDKKPIPKYKMASDAKDIPTYYSKIGELSDEIKADIEDLFCKFGAYSHVDLSVFLNHIVEMDGICQEDGTINLEELKNLNGFCFCGNKVIDYMFSHY